VYNHHKSLQRDSIVSQKRNTFSHVISQKISDPPDPPDPEASQSASQASLVLGQLLGLHGPS
jgi:hypothetical protein